MKDESVSKDSKHCEGFRHVNENLIKSHNSVDFRTRKLKNKHFIINIS